MVKENTIFILVCNIFAGRLESGLGRKKCVNAAST
jgi:hypothetical protein